MKIRRTANAFTLGVLLALATNSASAVWIEDFTGISDSTALESLSGWSKTAGTATIQGEQISAVAGAKFTRTLAGAEMITSSSGPGTFTMTWRDTHLSYDPSHVSELRLGTNDGTHAFIIRFAGNSNDDSGGQGPGTWDNTRDNTIQLSSGGADVDNPTYMPYTPSVSNYNSPWIRLVTYTLTLSDIDLEAGTAIVNMYTSQTWTGSSTSGTHPLDNQLITATGGGFSQIDYFSFAQGAGHAGSVFAFDNFSLTQVPEPGSAVLLLPGLAFFIGLGNRHRRRIVQA